MYLWHMAKIEVIERERERKQKWKASISMWTNLFANFQHCFQLNRNQQTKKYIVRKTSRDEKKSRKTESLYSFITL